MVIVIFIGLLNLAACANHKIIEPSAKPTAAAASLLPKASLSYRFVVSVQEQKMALLDGPIVVRTYPISTARNGVGEETDSGKTPRGRHKIATKIGDGAEVGAVFIDLLPTGEIVAPDTPGRTPVTTRILRLRGVEHRNLNTFERLIYLHGSPAESQLGKPVSGGCIRMNASDIVALYEAVEVGTDFFVYEEPLTVAIEKVIEADSRIGNMRLAADEGNIESVQKLCLGYSYGVDGVPFDALEAMRICTHGAQLSDAPSMALLGSLYEEGKGVNADPLNAKVLYERAAELGNPHGQFLLARMYQRGTTGITDMEQALRLLASAAAKGHQGAKRQLAERANP